MGAADMRKEETHSPASELRELRLGDRWEYSVAGALTSPDGQSLPIVGEIEVSIVPESLTGRAEQKTIRFSQNLEVTQPDGSKKVLAAPTWMFSFVQDAETADVAIAADNMGPGGARRIANAPQVFYPGRWTSKTRYDNQLDFDNGDFVRNTLNVVGQEWVETDRGSYLAWKSEIVSESAAMGRIEGVDWWTPELGAPARFSTNAGTPDGSRMLFVATLRESSVLPG
jgi:hypothetical protein